MVRRFKVGQPSEGARLDLFLASTCSDLSRSRIQKLIEEGAVRVARIAAKRSMRKEYLALAAGVPKVRKGEVACAIGRDPRDRKRMKAFRRAEPPPAGAREARTLYEIEREWFALGLTLLRCRLVTGRTHQIRVHPAAEKLAGRRDPGYGPPADGRRP